MKKLLLATSCLALSSTAVMAADMPMAPTKAVMMPAPVFSWTGCYVGAHVGGGMMTNAEGSSSGNGRGGVAGGQGGCNYQDGNWVFGVEGEGYWSGITNNSANSGVVNNPVFPGNTPFRDTSSLKNTNDFTIAGRAGIALDRTLIYGKGGWAWGSFKSDTSFADMNFAGVVTNSGSSSLRGTLDGPMFGIGVEHALTRNWTIKLEYDFIAYGTKELSLRECNFAAVCGVTGTTSLSATKQIFKFGANYLFDFGGPVVAKY
jgi:outer membrane immunogenic protein